MNATTRPQRSACAPDASAPPARGAEGAAAPAQGPAPAPESTMGPSMGPTTDSTTGAAPNPGPVPTDAPCRAAAPAPASPPRRGAAARLRALAGALQLGAADTLGVAAQLRAAGLGRSLPDPALTAILQAVKAAERARAPGLFLLAGDADCAAAIAAASYMAHGRRLRLLHAPGADPQALRRSLEAHLCAAAERVTLAPFNTAETEAGGAEGPLAFARLRLDPPGAEAAARGLAARLSPGGILLLSAPDPQTARAADLDLRAAVSGLAPTARGCEVTLVRTR